MSKLFFKGKEIEKKFASNFTDVDWSTPVEDRFKHFDLSVKFKIDVKGMKKRKRQDRNPDQTSTGSNSKTWKVRMDGSTGRLTSLHLKLRNTLSSLAS